MISGHPELSLLLNINYKLGVFFDVQFFHSINLKFDFISAFQMLLTNLPDLILDTPDAPTVLGNFLARAMADACMPPKTLQIFKEKIDNEYAR